MHHPIQKFPMVHRCLHYDLCHNVLKVTSGWFMMVIAGHLSEIYYVNCQMNHNANTYDLTPAFI